MESTATLLRPLSSPGGGLSTASASAENDDDRHMLPCRFFAHGYCHKGIRCRFYHPTPVHLRSSIRVPPLPPGFGQQGGSGRRAVVVTAEPTGAMRRDGGGRIFVPFARDTQIVHRQRSSAQQQYARPRPFSNLTNQYGRRSRSDTARQQFRMIPYAACAENAALKYAAEDGRDEEYYQHPYEGSGRVPLFIPPPPSQHQKDLQYNTIFKHIRWSEFLAPGQLPPAPTCVPLEKDGEKTAYSSAYNAATRRVAEASKAGGKQRGGRGAGDENDEGQEEQLPGPDRDAASKKLTAREELHFKVAEIAKELENEPKVKRNPGIIDSYFLKHELSEERVKLMITPEDISRIARENKMVLFGEPKRNRHLSPAAAAAAAGPMEKSPRNAVVERAAEEIARRLTISSGKRPAAAAEKKKSEEDDKKMS